MADEFLTRTCSNSWWSSSRNLFTGLSSPCSASLGEMGSFGWSFPGQDAAFASGDDHIPIGLHGSRRAIATESDTGSNLQIDSELPMSAFGLSSPTMDWNYSFVTGRTRNSFPSNSYSLTSSFEYPSPFLQELFEPDSLSHQSSFENQSGMSYNPSINSPDEQLQQSWPKILPHLLKTSPPKQRAANQLHLSNYPASNFWTSINDENKASLYSSPDEITQSQLFVNVFEDKQSSNNFSTKRNAEEIPDACSKKTKKAATSSEGSFKRLRMETPSPLPTFKVRKEKLGDRVTALQQLVSPFGKTDTASVLHEAIEYIKFLHDQVNVFSAPYMNNGAPMQQHQSLDHLLQSKDGGEQPKQDLLTRGLCLVPVSTTFAVTNETTSDFWTPSFGGAFR